MTADGAKKPRMRYATMLSSPPSVSASAPSSNWNTSEGGSGTDPARTHLTALLGFSKSPTRACTTSLRSPSTCSPSAPQLRPSSPGCARAVCTLNEVYASVCIVFIMELVAPLCDAAAEVSAAEAPTEGAEAKTVSYTFDPEAVEFYIMGCACCGELAVCVAFVDEPFGDVLDAPSPSTSSSSSAIKDGWDSSSRWDLERVSKIQADGRCRAVCCAAGGQGDSEGGGYTGHRDARHTRRICRPRGARRLRRRGRRSARRSGGSRSGSRRRARVAGSRGRRKMAGASGGQRTYSLF
ncbi:hypothetical protein K438DRAFT_525372 [Mycena galopus ATCC 62051]|nr:hypothetical protein K438DRAFT_525372 [Mycena galopus ATCC 62051]